MANTAELLQAILNNRVASAKDAFDRVMRAKTLQAIEQKRPEVAQKFLESK